jgi:RNA polymerase sigma-70 factor (ECF subfamily)
MTDRTVESVFREASGRIVAALAARFRDLALAEDAFADSCVRALEVWGEQGVPDDPPAWLYQVAVRAALDAIRRRQTRERYAPQLAAGIAESSSDDAEWNVIPDERLRLIFVCCHPAVAVDARAALTLRLVCGLPTLDIARAFLVPETTLAQRIVRAKRKIADAGVPFEVPGPEFWPERLDAVLSTLEVAYAKAHEDASGGGPHATYAAEVIELTRLLTELLPTNADVLALAATARFAEARRPSRVDGSGMMVPLTDQDPDLWDRKLIADGSGFLDLAVAVDGDRPRVVQARIHGLWCGRRSLLEAPPWRELLALYDDLLSLRDDPIVRLNRTVVVAEVLGVEAAIEEAEHLDAATLVDFLPYHAVCADLYRRSGKHAEARIAYDNALRLVETSAEHNWLLRQQATVRRG